ncbi:MAG TPA: hypothetical protein VEX12_15595 [Microbacterium sp.]|nr:hypothetical protein [Microbacterium sp.]
MSTPHRHLPPLQVRERAACMCVHGESCSTFAPGHALHLIQARLASATPSEWLDAIVELSDAADGVVVLRTIADAQRVELWSGSGAAHEVAPGTPVALHGRYGVLAVGSLRFNVAATPAQA